MNKESENRGKKITEHCMKIFGNHELLEISTTPNCCKKKIKKYLETIENGNRTYQKLRNTPKMSSKKELYWYKYIL